jgi:hypothetical protein
MINDFEKKQKAILLEGKDIAKLKQLAEVKGCSENAIVRGLIRGAKI